MAAHLYDGNGNLLAKSFEREVVHELKEVQKIVEECLAESDRCKNSDTYLIFKVWEKQGYYLRLPEGYHGMISSESVRRVRQKIQNEEGKFLPTDPQVCIKRKMKEEVLRRYFGAESNAYREYQQLRYNIQ